MTYHDENICSGEGVRLFQSFFRVNSSFFGTLKSNFEETKKIKGPY